MHQPGPQHRTSDPLTVLAGGGEMGERTRAFDWSKTPLGAIADWPSSLKTVVRIMLDSRYAMWLGWGSEFTFFYNDAYALMTLGPKHPWALGRSAREVWSEIWADIGPRAESVIRTGQATWDEGLLLFLEREGFPEETYHTFSYSPVPDDDGGVGGMLCVVTEDTERTIGERRLRTLRELAARTNDEARSSRTPASRPHARSRPTRKTSLCPALPAEQRRAGTPSSSATTGWNRVRPLARRSGPGRRPVAVPPGRRHGRGGGGRRPAGAVRPAAGRAPGPSRCSGPSCCRWRSRGRPARPASSSRGPAPAWPSTTLTRGFSTCWPVTSPR